MEIPILNVNVSDSFMEIEKTSGITNATMTANISKPELCLASNTLYVWTLYLRPPIKKDSPATSSRFPRTEPVKEAKTTSVSPSLKAKIAMINSTAFPNVALSKPPILGPATIAKLSVALPIKLERAMIVKQYTINMRMLGQCSNEPITDIGTPMKTARAKILFTTYPTPFIFNIKIFPDYIFPKLIFFKPLSSHSSQTSIFQVYLNHSVIYQHFLLF